MATFRNSVNTTQRETNMSFFEGLGFPMSPPETPPMKQDAKMTLRERTPLHKSIEQMFPNTPPQSPRMNSPRMNLKRTFSNNVKGLGFPLSPPNTPPMPSRMIMQSPSRMGLQSPSRKVMQSPSGMAMHSSLVRTLSESANNGLGSQLDYFSLKTRPSIVTVDVTEFPRRTLSRSSSYSLASANSASTPKDPLDRLRDYSTRSTDSVFLSPDLIKGPAYSPPPNTPATFSPTYHNYTNASFGEVFAHFGKEGSLSPYTYTGQGTPTQWRSSQYGSQHSHISSRPTNIGFQATTPLYTMQPDGSFVEAPRVPSIVDLEKARSHREPDRPQKKRNCACKTLICCAFVLPMLLLIATVIVLSVIIKLQNHNSRLGRRGCIDLPGMFVHGEWQSGYKKCT